MRDVTDTVLQNMIGNIHPRFYGSDQLHGRHQKTLETLGLGNRALTRLPSHDDPTLDLDALKAAVGVDEVVEVDEIFVGGKATGMDWRKRKTVVMGMMERDGDVMLKVVNDQTRSSLMPQINNNIADGTEIHTDELRTQKGHRRVPPHTR